jgi:hypothetical protein
MFDHLERLGLNHTAPAPATQQRPAGEATGPILRVPGLPLPPSLNNAYIGDGHYRRLTSEGKQFKAQAGLLISAAAARAGFTVPPKTWLRVTLYFFFAQNNRDGSNAVKLVEDAAASALGFNDKWVASMTWHKLVDKAMPRCDLAIEVLP